MSVYFELAFRLIEQLSKRPSIGSISAELEVLKFEHVSIQQSLKESHEHETKTKKKVEEKHAQDMSDMAEKLKTSNDRVKTLASKIKAYEAEASDVDEMIFRKDFTFLAYSSYLFSSQLRI
jgi:uncharacterized protein YlxW (UPF0749 family)